MKNVLTGSSGISTQPRKELVNLSVIQLKLSKKKNKQKQNKAEDKDDFYNCDIRSTNKTLFSENILIDEIFKFFLIIKSVKACGNCPRDIEQIKKYLCKKIY